MMASRSADACVVLDRVLEDAIDPYTRADALVQRLSALINLGRTAECTVAVDDAFDAAREIGEPYVFGHLHALGARWARRPRRFAGSTPRRCSPPVATAHGLATCAGSVAVRRCARRSDTRSNWPTRDAAGEGPPPPRRILTDRSRWASTLS
jgi:hypothetical protein